MDGIVDRKKSDLILDELKRRKSRNRIVDVEEETVKLVIFSLLDGYYAFYGDDVKEILPLVNIYYVPGSPDFIPGVINIRGDIESVININRFLDIQDSEATQNRKILVATKNSMRSGIMVDSIEDVVDLPLSSIKPPLQTLNKSIRDLVAGETMYRDRNVTLLDLGKIFARISL